jgi:ElaB/YqjD/DUF883 family membrane-anchored ribosome-binding protein
VDEPRNPIEEATDNAQRVADEVRTLLESGTSADLAERTRVVRLKLAEAESTLADAAAQVGDTFGPVLADIERDFANEIAVVEQRVRDKPLGALFAAAGIGLLLGLAYSHVRRGDSDAG